MEFRIADTFTSSLARLSGDEQKAVKTTAFDLQLNPELQRRSKSDPLSNIFQIHVQLGSGASRGGIEIHRSAHGVGQSYVADMGHCAERRYDHAHVVQYADVRQMRALWRASL